MTDLQHKLVETLLAKTAGGEIVWTRNDGGYFFRTQKDNKVQLLRASRRLPYERNGLDSFTIFYAEEQVLLVSDASERNFEKVQKLWQEVQAAHPKRADETIDAMIAEIEKQKGASE